MRHIDDLGLDRSQVMDAIRSDLLPRLPLPPRQNNTPFVGNVTIGGIHLDYTAYRLSDGSVNVGRITGTR